MKVSDFGQDVIVYRVNPGPIFNDFASFSMEACVENYSKAIAITIRHMAGASEAVDIRQETSLIAMIATCDDFYAGDEGTDTFWPRRFQGQQICVTGAPRNQRLLASFSAFC